MYSSNLLLWNFPGAGWVAGWVVGNCDFNENPVVHLDLDFDLGFVNKHSKFLDRLKHGNFDSIFWFYYLRIRQATFKILLKMIKVNKQFFRCRSCFFCFLCSFTEYLFPSVEIFWKLQITPELLIKKIVSSNHFIGHIFISIIYWCLNHTNDQ